MLNLPQAMKRLRAGCISDAWLLTKDAVRVDRLMLRQISCGMLLWSVLLLDGTAVKAQITPDGTLGSERSSLTRNAIVGGGIGDRIDGGAIRGSNLFHSFSEFNVETGQRLYFANPANIQNILARVTGKNLSNIDGTLGVDGTANLFLMNPNGIIFGKNASLDVRGSFIGTTTNAIRFGDQGIFSATTPEKPALLTVQPSALLFTQINPGAIENQAFLRVADGHSLLLVGGDIRQTQGDLAAYGGRVELGGLAEPGSVAIEPIDQALSLQFPDTLTRSNIIFDNSSIDVTANNGGSSSIYARNLTLTSQSRIIGGIYDPGGSVESQAGDIKLDIADALRLELGSYVENDVNPNRVGNSGNLKITAGSFGLLNGSFLSASVYGEGNSGAIEIKVRDRLSFNRSNLYNQIKPTGSGRSGGIWITGNTLELLDGSQFSTGVFGSGRSGDINLDIPNQIVIRGGELKPNVNPTSGIFSTVEENAIGQAGAIRLATGMLSLSGISQISSGIAGRGIAGDINVQAQTLRLDSKENSIAPTGIFSGIAFSGVGRGGSINIDASSLQLLNGAEIQSGVGGVGFGGSIRIRAQAITLSGSSPGEVIVGEQVDSGSKITAKLGISGSIVDEDGTEKPFGIGQAGNIEIETQSLILRDQASIATLSNGQGDAGRISIKADTIALSSGDNTISSSAFNFGNASNVAIQTRSLRLQDGSQISAFTEGEGASGNISIKATGEVELAGFNAKNGTPTALFTDNAEISKGASGNITIEADHLQIADGATVNALTRNDQPGGNITIRANRVEAVNGGQIITVGEGSGRAGTIAVHATNQLTIDGQDPSFAERVNRFGTVRIGLIDAASGLYVRAQGTGSAGNIQVDASTVNLNRGGKLSADSASGNGGGINIQNAALLLMRRNSSISTNAGTFGTGGNGGDIGVNAKLIVAPASENSDISADAFSGSGGRVNISTQGLFGIQARSQQTSESDITASSQSGVQGSVSIAQPEVQPTQGITELPVDILDASNQIAQICPRGRDLGRFVVSGRGSAPPNPINALPGTSMLNPLSTLDGTPANRSTVNPITQPTPPAIVEAQGWIKTRDGIELVAHTNETIPPTIAACPTSTQP